MKDAWYVGGMNAPSVFWRLTAHFPFSTLRLGPTTVRLRLTLWNRRANPDFEAPYDVVARAFRLRGRVFSAGIGIELDDGVEAYFWTYAFRDAILTGLAVRGVPVDPEPRRASQRFRTGVSTDLPVTPIPARTFGDVLPFLVLIGAFLVAFLALVIGTGMR